MPQNRVSAISTHVIQNTIKNVQVCKKESLPFFFYSKMATLSWAPDQMRWVDGSWFLNYTTKLGIDTIINRIPDESRVADKWQGYLPGN